MKLSADALNRTCACEARPAAGLAAFHSQTPVFIESSQARTMRRVIEAVHSVMRLPAWKEAVLGVAPPLARIDPGIPGVFAGFDFHLTPAPKLIEINTNADGALSARELEVMRWIAAGHTARAVAEALGISKSSVDTYRARIFDKLGVENRAELLARLASMAEGPTDID